MLLSLVCCDLNAVELRCRTARKGHIREDAFAYLSYSSKDMYTIIGRSLVNIYKGLEPRKCRSMNARQ